MFEIQANLRAANINICRLLHQSVKLQYHMKSDTFEQSIKKEIIRWMYQNSKEKQFPNNNKIENGLKKQKL